MFSAKVSSPTLTVEGIVLRSLVYKERERILSLFTKDDGLISLIVKQITGKKYNLLVLTAPFSSGEYVLSKGNSDMYRFYDGSLIDEHLFLRDQWRYLETASAFAQAILRSQMPGKPAPLLYSLFLAYLKQIPFFEDPSSLTASFYLKMLHHEGHLSQTDFHELISIRSFNELKEHKISADNLKKIKDQFTSLCISG